MLAKQIATVDRISGGRVEAALAAGFFQRELESSGVPFLTPRGRADRLREGFEIVDGLLRQRRMTYSGAYFRLDDAQLVPTPVQTPRPPLYVAANGRRGLRLAVERGDGSVSLGDEEASAKDALAALRERNALLDEYCIDAGRDPGSLERLYFTGWAEEKPFSSPQAFDDFVGVYREAGVTRFIFIFTRNESAGSTVTRESLEAFAAEKLAGL
jgi:alkanesulfonate monooxygenase SsuD/methylene tetrahydromethanopterin reductase-like flavin-dependent oxidoreductase (luciferase family)